VYIGDVTGMGELHDCGVNRSCSLPVVYVIKSGVWSKSHAKRSHGTPKNTYVRMILKRYCDHRL